MGRCGTCQGQTHHFCFVHEQFVCENCLILPNSIHSRCVLSTYRNWVQDRNYDWPPTCPQCKNTIESNEKHVRAPCLHVFHIKCVKEDCPACEKCFEWEGSELADEFARRLGRVSRSSQESQPESNVPVKDPPALSEVVNEPNSKGPAVKAHPTPTHQSSESSTLPQLQRNRPSPTSVSATNTMQSPPAFQPAPLSPDAKPDLRLDMGSSKSTKKSTMTSSWRRKLKAGARKWFDLKKVLMENQRQLSILAISIICVTLLLYLMSNDEDDESITVRTITDDSADVHLPHIRVNPALLQNVGNR